MVEIKDLENVKPVVSLQEDDEFEDFPCDVISAADNNILIDEKQWEDTWEDDDEAQDFAVQLAAQEGKRQVAPMRM